MNISVAVLYNNFHTLSHLSIPSTRLSNLMSLSIHLSRIIAVFIELTEIKEVNDNVLDSFFLQVFSIVYKLINREDKHLFSDTIL